MTWANSSTVEHLICNQEIRVQFSFSPLEEKKQKMFSLRNLVRFIVFFILIFLVNYYYFELKEIVNIYWVLIISFVVSIVILLGIIFNNTKEKRDRNKEEEERNKRLKEFLKRYKTEELEGIFKEFKQVTKQLDKEYSKRKDKNLKNIVGEEFENIIKGGFVIFIFSFFMFGAIPSYFNVNNEFLNPSESSIGLNHALNTLIKPVSDMLIRLMEIGSNNYKAMFWIYFLVVFYFLIHPIIKIIITVINKIRSKNVNKRR